MRFVFNGFANTPPDLNGRVHITDGTQYWVQELAAKCDQLKAQAGAGPIVYLTPANLYGWEYARAVEQMCGVPAEVAPASDLTIDHDIAANLANAAG